MRIAYYRVSTGDQSIDAQRHAMGGKFDREFSDEGVSGGTQAAERPGFARLLEHVRDGDTVCVYAVDRLGRDALDVQSTVRRLLRDGVAVDVHGLGPIAGEVGELILAVLAQIADMERRKIRDRTQAGRAAAKEALRTTGRTHRGKESLGRPKAQDLGSVIQWRNANHASIKQTAEAFGISTATVKRYAAIWARDPLNTLPIEEPPKPSTADVLASLQSPTKQMIANRKRSRLEAQRPLPMDRDPLD